MPVASFIMLMVRRVANKAINSRVQCKDETVTDGIVSIADFRARHPADYE